MDQIKMRLNVFVDCQQGGRKYMEDYIDIREIRNADGIVDGIYVAVFDGHGGYEAAKFAKYHLFQEIIKQKAFWSFKQDAVIKAIKDGFLSAHSLMWKVYGSWSKTNMGFPSTAGTTATVAIIRNGLLYIAHVGDSTAVLATNDKTSLLPVAQCLTQDHKPTLFKERKRIEENGGTVQDKAGVKRVVWRRSRMVLNGLRRTNITEDIPFLAVSRSLGDFWSYDVNHKAFVVSPEPDVTCVPLDASKLKFLIVASDGLWNVARYQEVVNVAHEALDQMSGEVNYKDNPASALTGFALSRWAARNVRADNTSAIFVSFTPIQGSDTEVSSHLSEDVDEEFVAVVDCYSSAGVLGCAEDSVFMTPENSEDFECSVLLDDSKEMSPACDRQQTSSCTASPSRMSMSALRELASDKTSGFLPKISEAVAKEEYTLPDSPVTPVKNNSVASLCLPKTFISPRSTQVLQRLRTRLSLPPLSTLLSECEVRDNDVSTPVKIEERDQRAASLPSIAATTRGRAGEGHVLESLSLNRQTPDILNVRRRMTIHSISAGLQNKSPGTFIGGRKRRVPHDNKQVAIAHLKKACSVNHSGISFSGQRRSQHQ